MNPLLRKMLARVMAPATEFDAGGGGIEFDFGTDGKDAAGSTAADRGDAHEDDAAPVSPPAAKKGLADQAEADAGPDGDDPAGGLDEGAADLQEQAEAGDTTVDVPKKPGGRIPVARHEKILATERAKREALEAQLAQYQQGHAVAQANASMSAIEDDLGDLSDKYNDALGSGDLDEAKKLFRQIQAKNSELRTAATTQATAEAESRAAERIRFEATVDRLEAAYPVLDKEHEDFDQDLTNDVLAFTAALRGKGFTPAKALQKAVERLCGKPETAAQRKAVETEVRVSAREAAAEAGATRKSDAVQRSVDTNKRVPPKTSSVGQDSTAAGGGLTAEQAMKLTDKEYAKLPNRLKAQLRGDSV